jgi:N-acetylglucosamine-6-sulfatase
VLLTTRLPRSVAILCVVLLAAAVRAEAPSGATVAGRPNIVVVLVDDLRADAMSGLGHPIAETPHMDRLAREGARFRNAFVTTSLCGPSRASLLTGLYAHLHDVRGNTGRDLHPEDPSLHRLLQAAGYRPAFIGTWHRGRGADPRPGFDYWLSFKGQGDYRDPTLNENGKEIRARGYVTDLLGEYAVDWLSREHDEPFLLIVSHKAVHGPFIPAPRHAELYADVAFPAPPSFSDTLESKPAWQRAVASGIWRHGMTLEELDLAGAPPRVSGKAWDPGAQRLRNYFRTLRAVDEGLGRILETLEVRGLLENTAVVLASDNGYSLGEHRRFDKRTQYEESIRVPLLIRAPGTTRAGSEPEQLALNIDLAPTILELAGVAVPGSMQGSSLVPVLKGDAKKWRRAFLYEYFYELPFVVPTILGVRDERFSYASQPGIDDIEELYDLRRDPRQMRNLAVEPEFAPRLKEMRGRLAELLRETRYRELPRPRPERVVETELVLHFDFNASAGRVVKDGSRHGNHGRLDPGLEVQDEALACKGAGMLEVENSGSLDPAGVPFAVELRARALEPDGILIARGGRAHGWALVLREGRPVFVVNGTGRRIEAVADVGIGQGWHHVAGVLERDGQAKVYLDGRLVGVSASRRMIPGEPAGSMQICNERGSRVSLPDDAPGFRGSIDEVRVFRGEVEADAIRVRALAARAARSGSGASD